MTVRAETKNVVTAMADLLGEVKKRFGGTATDTSMAAGSEEAPTSAATVTPTQKQKPRKTQTYSSANSAAAVSTTGSRSTSPSTALSFSSAASAPVTADSFGLAMAILQQWQALEVQLEAAPTEGAKAGVRAFMALAAAGAKSLAGTSLFGSFPKALRDLVE